MTLLPIGEAALWLAKHGAAVFPLHTVDDGRCSCSRDCSSPGKHPRTERGVLDATRHEIGIIAWWRRWPDANIGVATGAASGVVVLDIDAGKGGTESIKALQAKHGKLPRTPTVATGGGGWHLYFRHPGGLVRNSVRKLGPGLDVRADGGYVVAPPSIHATGKAYRWTVKASPEVPAAELPPWLLALTFSSAIGKPRAVYLDKYRNGIANGERDAHLASLAGRYMSRGLRHDEVAEILYCVNAQRCRPPLAEKDVLKIVRSISRYHSTKETA